nr:molybdenum cofactor guanylyltransferase [Euzebyales bacterium]
MTAADRLAPPTGLVLAGGASVRPGADKARLDFRGRPLLLHAVDVLGQLCDEVLVASGDGMRFDDLGVRQVADVASGAGPLAGLIAGLEAATTQLVAAVAVNLPFASADVLRLLAARWRGEPAVVPLVERRLQPLHAVWAVR